MHVRGYPQSAKSISAARWENDASDFHTGCAHVFVFGIVPIDAKLAGKHVTFTRAHLETLQAAKTCSKN